MQRIGKYGRPAGKSLFQHKILPAKRVEIGTKPVCTNPRCITQTQHYLPPLVKKIGGVDCCGFCDAALR